MEEQITECFLKNVRENHVDDDSDRKLNLLCQCKKAPKPSTCLCQAINTMKTNKISVDLLMSTYNWPTALESIFISLLNQSQLPDNILLADDGSSYKTQLLVEKYKKIFPAPLIHVWHSDLGFRKTLILNKAMKLAKSEYIIQIDGDILLHRHFIKDHLNFARKNSFVQGCRVFLNQEGTQEVIHSGRSKFSPFSNKIRNRINATRIPILSPIIMTDPRSPKNIKGCNLAFWRNDFESVNGYENSFKGWGYEDDELAARFINSGIRKRRLKFSGICYHLNHAQSKKENVSKNRILYHETLITRKIYSENGLAQV